MRIACPSCAAEYEVPASCMTPQRKVRCARCGGEWKPVRETDETPPTPAPAQAEDQQNYSADARATLPPVTAMDRLSAAASGPRPTASLIAAWVMTLVAVVGAVGAVIAWREPLTRIWPPSS